MTDTLNSQEEMWIVYTMRWLILAERQTIRREESIGILKIYFVNKVHENQYIKPLETVEENRMKQG